MNLSCVGDSGRDLPADVLAMSGNTTLSRFDLTVGREYTAYAMALWTYGLGVLVVNDTSRTFWMPISLFQVVDGSLPAHWEFAVVADRKPVLALWGYPSLIHDPEHHDALIEREQAAFDVFIRESGCERRDLKG